MKVQEIYKDKPQKKIIDLNPGEVFKYYGDWFMVVAINVENICPWSEFVDKHIHNPNDIGWCEYELTPCILLETGDFCYLSDNWIVDDYGEAEMRVQLER